MEFGSFAIQPMISKINLDFYGCFAEEVLLDIARRLELTPYLQDIVKAKINPLENKPTSRASSTFPIEI